MLTFENRVRGGLLGLLIGDALGVPYEFHDPHEIPAAEAIEFDPPPDFARSYPHVPPGTWSDDGAQALCLLASLLHCHSFDPRDFANRLVKWREHGYMAVGGRIFDVGNQTDLALRRLRQGVPPLEAGGTDEFAQGNGSLMRTLPLALWHRGPDAELARLAHDQSKITHGHVVPQVCCALYCLWARRIIEERRQAWDDAVLSLRQIYAGTSEYRPALDEVLNSNHSSNPGGSGYVVDSLFSAQQALDAGPYERVVKAAVGFGRDTDTTACIAGGLAGIRDGIDAIPIRWRLALRDRNEAEQLLTRLLDWHKSQPSAFLK